jgi:recombination protein RecT
MPNEKEVIENVKEPTPPEAAVEQQTPAANRVIDKLSEPHNQQILFDSIGDEKLVSKFKACVAMEITTTPALQKCTPSSIIKSAFVSANLGLMINKNLGHAWLIPYTKSEKIDGEWVKKSECQLQIGYKGYISKFEENKYSIEVEVVTQKELDDGCFKEVRGTNPKIEHSPIRDGEMRVAENIALAYAIAFKSGRKPIMAVMTKEEMMEAAMTEYYDVKQKKKVKGLKGVWRDQDNLRATDFAEMCKKTVIRRLAKSVPVNITNHMISFEAERDIEMADVTPIDEDPKDITTNMSYISGEDGAGLSPQEKEPSSIPDEFPVMDNGKIVEGLFTCPLIAGEFLLEKIRDCTDEGRDKSVYLRENGAVIKYLAINNSEEAHSIIEELYNLSGVDTGEYLGDTQ